ncbi:MAG: hypothetical protein M4579_000953 [Chaenotheca gracillima]|nr:MAG: hypothetical protein M4579_000953 [Chaenotheca gracillima]
MPAAPQGYYAAPTLPINMSPNKSAYYRTPPSAYKRASLSPPEVDSGTVSSASSAIPSYSNSATSSNYGGSSTGDYDSSGYSAGSGVDLMDLLNDRLTDSFDPLPLDRNLATQAQTSGALNAKHRELLALQAEAQRRLASSRANFADGIKAAKEVKRDLDWTQKRVSSLKSRAERKYPTEYGRANARYPAPVDY